MLWVLCILQQSPFLEYGFFSELDFHDNFGVQSHSGPTTSKCPLAVLRASHKPLHEDKCLSLGQSQINCKGRAAIS